jgi:Sulfatase
MSDQRPAVRTETGGARGLLRDAAHLTVLCAFAIAQPLFSLLGDNAEFFAARNAPAVDIVLFALAATLLPPLLLTGLELAAGLAGRRVRSGLHLLFVAVLTGLLAIQVLKRVASAPTSALLAATAVAGVACALAYARSRPLRSTLTALSPAPLLFLAFFLFLSPVSKLVLPAEEPALAATARANAPVVMLILDEFSLNDLLLPDGRIDTVRYPNFGRLAARSTWYRNATTVYDSTTQAVPALLSGRLPRKGELPTLRDHPGNLFTLLGRRGRTNVSEEATGLCPDELCPAARSAGLFTRLRALGEDLGLVYLHEISPPSVERELPSISQGWGDFGADEADGAEAEAEAPEASAAAGRPTIHSRLNGGRGKRLEAWIAAIRARTVPTLNVKHALLPHEPLVYLPSGAAYRTRPNEPIPGQTSKPSWDDQLLVDQAYQRHLLQVGYADHQLGALIDRLERTGLWDEALVVVTADHGVAYRRGEDRRIATRANLAEVAPVPLFVKAPGQRRGATSDAWMRTIDVLPTIAALLHVQIPWRHDGRPPGSAEVRGRRSVTMLARGFGGSVTLDTTEFSRRRSAVLARKARLFGSGGERPGLYGLGPNPGLVGRALAELEVAPRGARGPRVSINDPGALSAVDRDSGIVPAQLTGTVDGDAAGARHDFALAVNGRVEAVTRSAYLDGDAQQYLAAMLPEESLLDGANLVRVLLVQEGGARPRLTEVGRAGGRR